MLLFKNRDEYDMENCRPTSFPFFPHKLFMTVFIKIGGGNIFVPLELALEITFPLQTSEKCKIMELVAGSHRLRDGRWSKRNDCIGS